jgi:PAS domain S-box-containing protein
MAAPTILVVDDEMIIARELESRLTKLGYHVHGVAASAREAIRMAQEARPALVLMDIVLKGDLDGIDAAEEIRNRLPGTPIIYLTAYTDEETLRRARATEPSGYIVKPFSEGELRANIEMALYKGEAERRLRGVETWFSASMQGLSEGVLATDGEGRISFANAKAERLTGWSLQEAVNRPLEQVLRIVSGRAPVPATQIVEQVMRDGVLSRTGGDLFLLGRSGEAVPVELAAARLRNRPGGATGAVILVRDLSQQSRIERVLHETEEELRRTNQALREADRRKDDFLATLAHELRNPLAPIRNAVAILRQKGPDEPALVWARNVIDRQVDQLTRLIDDLLDTARISRGKLVMHKRPVELDRVIDMALETSRPHITAAGHLLSILLPREPVLLEADPTRLAQVFSNLLNNASKYTEPGGAISLAASLEGSQVMVCIEDNGIGFPQEAALQLFEPFSQWTGAPERANGGLGIGLSLVRGIVALHDGSVEARSEGPGRGSQFRVHLPIALGIEEPGHEPQRAAPLAAPADLRVLVADDNVDAADTLQRLLGLFGYEVRVAYDGESALQLAEAFRPQAAVLDIGMPGMNGYELARTMRKRHGDLILIALTGWGQESDRQRSAEAGFDRHLTKPVDPSSLQRLLLELLSREGRPAQAAGA